MSTESAAPAPVVTLDEKNVRYMATFNSEHGYERVRVTAYAGAKPSEAIELADGIHNRRYSPAEARALAKALVAAADAAQLAQ